MYIYINILLGNCGNTRTTTYFKCLLVLIPTKNEFETFVKLDLNSSITVLEKLSHSDDFIETTFCEKFKKLTHVLTGEKSQKDITAENLCLILNMLKRQNNLTLAKFYLTKVITKEKIKSQSFEQLKTFGSELGNMLTAFGWKELRAEIMSLIYPVFKQENILINCYLAKVNLFAM